MIKYSTERFLPHAIVHIEVYLCWREMVTGRLGIPGPGGE